MVTTAYDLQNLITICVGMLIEIFLEKILKSLVTNNFWMGSSNFTKLSNMHKHIPAEGTVSQNLDKLSHCCDIPHFVTESRKFGNCET